MVKTVFTKTAVILFFAVVLPVHWYFVLGLIGREVSARYPGSSDPPVPSEEQISMLCFAVISLPLSLIVGIVMGVIVSNYLHAKETDEEIV
jgi:hypothetical protein